MNNQQYQAQPIDLEPPAQYQKNYSYLDDNNGQQEAIILSHIVISPHRQNFEMNIYTSGSHHRLDSEGYSKHLCKKIVFFFIKKNTPKMIRLPLLTSFYVQLRYATYTLKTNISTDSPNGTSSLLRTDGAKLGSISYKISREQAQPHQQIKIKQSNNKSNGKHDHKAQASKKYNLNRLQQNKIDVTLQKNKQSYSKQIQAEQSQNQQSLNGSSQQLKNSNSQSIRNPKHSPSHQIPSILRRRKKQKRLLQKARHPLPKNLQQNAEPYSEHSQILSLSSQQQSPSKGASQSYQAKGAQSADSFEGGRIESYVGSVEQKLLSYRKPLSIKQQLKTSFTQLDIDALQKNKEELGLNKVNFKNMFGIIQTNRDKTPQKDVEHSYKIVPQSKSQRNNKIARHPGFLNNRQKYSHSQKFQNANQGQPVAITKVSQHNSQAQLRASKNERPSYRIRRSVTEGIQTDRPAQKKPEGTQTEIFSNSKPESTQTEKNQNTRPQGTQTDVSKQSEAIQTEQLIIQQPKQCSQVNQIYSFKIGLTPKRQRPQKKQIRLQTTDRRIQKEQSISESKFDFIVNNLSINLKKKLFGRKSAVLSLSHFEYTTQKLHGSHLLWVGKGYLFRAVSFEQFLILKVKCEIQEDQVELGRVRVPVTQLLLNYRQGFLQLYLHSPTVASEILGIIVLGYETFNQGQISAHRISQNKSSSHHLSVNRQSRNKTGEKKTIEYTRKSTKRTSKAQFDLKQSALFKESLLPLSKASPIRARKQQTSNKNINVQRNKFYTEEPVEQEQNQFIQVASFSGIDQQ